MKTVGDIRNQIMNDINEKNAETYGAIIMQAINTAYKIVLGEHNWHCAKTYVEPSAAVVAAPPVILPSDVSRVTAVANYVSSCLDYETYYQDHSNGRVPKHYRNWYYDKPVQTALQSSDDDDTGQVSVDQRGLTVTLGGSTAWSASAAGEYIQIGSHAGLYEISSRDSDTQITLVERYRGPTVLAARWIIRPPIQTRRIRLIDADRNPMYPTALKIHYQRDMLPLVDDSDLVPIPNDASPVYWKAYQISARRKGWTGVADRLEVDYNHALGLAKREDPSASSDSLKPVPVFRRPRPEGLHNRRSLMGNG